MFFDNIMIFLNVLEQFAIRANIFDFDAENIFKYVNKLYFNNNDEIIQTLVNKSSGVVIEPKKLIKDSVISIDNTLAAQYNSQINFEKVAFVYPISQELNFRFLY
jgi:hypothetical protein